MSLKINDLIITNVWNVAGFHPVTLKPLFFLKNCNTTTFDVPSTKSEITGGRGGRVLAVVSANTKATLTVESATFDLNLLALQTGDDSGIYGTNVDVPYSERITVPASVAYTSTLVKTPSADEIVSVLFDDGSVAVESETVTATTFTVSGKVLTFDSSYANKSGTAFFYTKASEAVEINIDADANIQYALIQAEISVQNQCDGLDYMGYIIMPRASVDKSFQMQTSKDNSNNAIHNAVFDAIATCNNTFLAKIVIYDENSLT